MQVLLALAIVGLLAGQVQGSTTATNAPPAPTGEPTNTVQVIPATEALLKAASTSGESIRLLIETAQPTIGVPYEWGGVNLESGVDCSGYTWQLLEKAGAGYDRYLDTRALSGIEKSHGLRKIPYE